MKKIILLSLIFFTLIADSCKKTLDVTATRVVNETNYWNTLEDARAAIMGVYGLTRAALADQNGYWIYGDVRMGNFASPNRQDLKAIINNNLNANYPVINELSNWRRFYAIVNAANIFIERIHEVKEKDARYTENNMTVDLAQVHFLRAFAYFYMVRIWGDVPLILSSREGTFENKPKTNQSAILTFVQSEMEAAALNMPYEYSTQDIQQPGNYYNQGSLRWSGALAKKLGAYAMLAQVAAWEGKYSDVIRYTKIVLTDYSTRDDLSLTSTENLTLANGFFYTGGNKNNDNQLFAFGFNWDNQDAAFTGNIESLTLAAPVVNKNVPDIFVPKDSILSIFSEVGDGRFNIDTTGVTHSDAFTGNVHGYFTNFLGKYPIFAKIKVVMGGTTSANADDNFRLFSSSIVLTRLEDVYLMRAEAYAVLGENDLAIADLNTVRQERYNVDQQGLTNASPTDYVVYNPVSSGPLIDAIFKERQREFMGEGQHWFDRVRMEKIKQSNPEFLKLINSGGIYWPISRDILAQNPLLSQNSYWK